MKRVLIVDDDLAILDSLSMLLDDAYEVTTARNGDEALRAFAAGVKPDAVVLDLMMPIMDGETTVKALDSRGIAVPIILVSAANELAAIASRLGVFGFVEKPIDAKALEHALARAVR